jgi:hypothetical protein
MKKMILTVSLLFGCQSFSNAGVINANKPASNLVNQKPNHYGDWDVIYDKVLKKTTLIHQHRPYGELVPGMGDSFTQATFYLQYSFEADLAGTPGTSNYKVKYYWVFDNTLAGTDAAPGLVALAGLFKYSSNTQFTLLIDGQSFDYPVQGYHTGVYGDAIIGQHPYEEFRVPISQDILNKLVVAKEVDGNLSSDDQNANKSFTFDQTFKEIVNAFVFRVNEINNSSTQ